MNNKFLAAHNACSGYRPLKWYDYLTNIFSKCQTKNFEELYNCGVRLFDIRFRINKKGDIRVSHGLTSYNINLMDELNKLYLLKKTDEIIYLRIVNENELLKSNTDKFIEICNIIMKNFPDFKYQIYTSKVNNLIVNEFTDIQQTYSIFWLKGEWFFPPLLYSKLFNKLGKRLYKEFIPYKKTAWWFDFI